MTRTSTVICTLLFIGVNMSHAQQEWPSLPHEGFISGRPATVQDVNEGNAIFVAKIADVAVGKPIQIRIPQYAYWTSETGKRVPVIVVQAEEANGFKLFGIRDASGKEYGCTGLELTLLGTMPPN